MFAEAVRENAAYKGWVRIDVSNDPFDGEITKYSNKNDGTRIEITCTDKGNKEVRLTRPSSREEWLYDGDTNLILAGTVNPTYLLRPTGSSIDLESMLKDFGITEGEENTVFQRSSEGSLSRIDVETTISHSDFHSPDQPRETKMKLHLTVWIDPVSKLVQRVSLKDGGPKLREFRFTYGGDFRGDLYEFGVPKDAQVVDRRMTLQAREILERLIRRHDRISGEYIAILSTKQEWKSDPDDIGDVTIYSRSDRRQVSHSYQVLSHENPSEGIAVNELKDWPTPELQSTLDSLRSIQPWISRIRNENEASWLLVRNGDKLVKIFPDGGDIDPVFPHIGLDSIDRLCGLYGRATIEPVSGHEDWIAVRGEETQQFEATIKKDWSRRTSLRVIDPNRSDLTISYSEQRFYSDSPNPVYEKRITFDSFVKDSNGSWYPTQWKEVATRHKDNGEVSSVTFESHLQVFPNQTLDDSWFRNHADYSAPTTAPSN
ncbi:MAG TPA: hypothetical protein PK402_05105 [Tepidisphaeraceae bacterium]|nr:hypothetical protein [Tepidisphaeraceae bacterium]